MPGGIDVPTDTDGNGLYDDVNGNGRKDFADVVLYFNQMIWITTYEPVAAFDYNGNGRIDFADVVQALQHPLRYLFFRSPPVPAAETPPSSAARRRAPRRTRLRGPRSAITTRDGPGAEPGKADTSPGQPQPSMPSRRGRSLRDGRCGAGSTGTVDTDREDSAGCERLLPVTLTTSPISDSAGWGPTHPPGHGARLFSPRPAMFAGFR